MKEKIKFSLKVLSALVGLFILWILFGMITVRNSSDYSVQQEKLGTGFSSRMSVTSMNEDSGMVYSESADPDDIISTDIELPQKKVIKNGNLSLKVDKTEEAAQKITTIAKNQGGEIFSTDFYERVKGQKSGNLTVKVPVENFEIAVEEIKAVATQVVSESTTGQDVTEQYADLQAQLKNKRAEEESFVKILDRAGEIEDVLAVTKQISRVRGEIERLEGRIKLMDSQTDMSTIYVNLSEDIEITPIQNDWRPWQVTKKAFNDSISNLQGFIDGLIRFVIVGIPSIIPFLLFVWIIYWIGKKIWSKIRK